MHNSRESNAFLQSTGSPTEPVLKAKLRQRITINREQRNRSDILNPAAGPNCHKQKAKVITYVARMTFCSCSCLLLQRSRPKLVRIAFSSPEPAVCWNGSVTASVRRKKTVPLKSCASMSVSDAATPFHSHVKGRWVSLQYLPIGDPIHSKLFCLAPYGAQKLEDPRLPSSYSLLFLKPRETCLNKQGCE